MAREKRREELHIAVPSLFRCPISMDVMKSPVSLCTGVTYDRSSIETWLALGHNTCPATMQTLLSTHTTPNLTLRRLINLWLAQAVSSPTSAISKPQVAQVMKGDLNPVSLEKMVGFIKASEENLKFVAQSCDAISRFIEVFGKPNEIRVSELIAEIFYFIAQENVVGERLINELILKSTDGETDCLSSFTFVLQKGGAESKVKCAKILELMALNPKSQRTIAGKPELLHELCNLLTVETDTSAAEASFSALSAISNSRQAKKELIRFGLVARVGKILSSSEARAVNEKALGMLVMIATCAEGRAAIAADEDCVMGIVKKLIKCSGEATESGIRVLWSVCTLAQGKVGKVNGLTKVLLVMQSDCSESTRQMCGELVKVLRSKNVNSNLGPYETRTTHITPY